MNGTIARDTAFDPAMAASALGPSQPNMLSALLLGAHRSTLDVDVGAVDWIDTARTACKGGLGGILLAAAEHHGWSIPERPLTWLRQQALQIRMDNFHMMRRLRDIATRFRGHNVEALLLKGAALNLTLYDRAELRPMSDVDLLVRPEAVTAAMRTLEQLGFRRGPGLVRSDFFPRFHYEVEYCSDEARPVRIDLHVRPFRPSRYARTVPTDAFWEDSETYDLCGAEVRVCSVEDQFIHLATHSACHGHCRLLWLYDIRRLIDFSGAAFDWDRMVSQCRRYGLAHPVRLALLAVEAAWGQACPERARRRLTGEAAGWRDRLCLAQAPHDAERPVRHVAVDLLCTPGVVYRFGYLWRMLIPDRCHLEQVYARRHAGWMVFAHVGRWLRAAIRVLGLPRAVFQRCAAACR